MNDFIEAMIQGLDYTKYKWINGICADKCFICDFNNNSIKTMRDWQSEGVSKQHHGCERSCRIEKV